VAIASLALGVGANAAIFSMLDRALLRPLPVKNPGQLVLLTSPGANRVPSTATTRTPFLACPIDRPRAGAREPRLFSSRASVGPPNTAAWGAVFQASFFLFPTG